MKRGDKHDCYNCGGDGYSIEGGDCPACKGEGRVLYNPLPRSQRFYVEYRSGNCTVITADSKDAAREHAGNGTRVPNDRIRIVRVATADDVDWFTSSGGTIR